MQTALEKLRLTTPLRITISGDIGSGKSTFAKHLAEDLQIERIYIGALMREEAARRNLTLDDFMQMLISDDRFDHQVDNLQQEKSKVMERGIFEGRTSWHFVISPKIRIFFKVSPQVAAERLWKSNDPDRDKYQSIEEIIVANELRRSAEEKRYQNYYNINVYDPRNFDVIINTSNKTIEQVYTDAVEAISKMV